MRIVLGVVLVIGCSKSPDQAAPGAGGADDVTAQLAQQRRKLATILTQKMSFEAYPMWAAQHPGSACPAALAELLEYMNERSDRDPWGAPLRMQCGGDLPPGAKGIAIWSLGPDGKDGTADDIKAWESK
jgi:hypothetical protein